ncbi:MAG: helix-turn-helix transcriptional regulator [Ruthenibacterium sp.]
MNNKLSCEMGARKLKIADVARKTGISRTTLTALYYGTSKRISFETLDKLCKFFGCGTEALLQLNDEKESTPCK